MADKTEILTERDGPVMVATLDPGFAWMVMATVDGGRRRRQPGNLISAGQTALAAGAEPPFAFPRLGGAISLPELNTYSSSAPFFHEAKGLTSARIRNRTGSSSA